MKEILVKDIIEVCEGKLLYGNENIVCNNFSKDTREIETGDTYIAIKGENFNGNLFYEEALKKKATVCILDENCVDTKKIEIYKDIAIVLVNNTIEAIQKLATYKRSLYDIPVIAVTGSVGKTSTKDIIANVMNTQYKTLKTEGNLNNHIGLPLTLLKLKDHEAAVIEMGMSHFGEIETLSKIAKPTMCVITNVGTSHIGNLGSRENILKAKLEILEGMNEKGIVVINNDNDLLNEWQLKNIKYNIVTYGIDNDSNLTAKDIEIDINNSTYNVIMDNKKEEIYVPVSGKHFIYNSLCAICVGIQNGIDIENIKRGIKEFELTKNRMEIINSSKGFTIINDAYNASFDSMKASLNYLGSFTNKRKVACLGDMLELGEFSKQLHQDVGKEVLKNNIDVLITGGEEAKNISNLVEKENNNIKVYKYNNTQDIIENIDNIIKKDDIVLVKASNGMKFIKIVEKLK